MAISIVRQYSVFLPNRPGALSEFTKLFMDQGINIIGIASEIRGESGVVHVTVDSDKRIGYILTQAGFTTVESPILSIELPDKVGQLYKLSKLLGEMSVNITTVYGTSIGGGVSRLLISVTDFEKVRDSISKIKLED